MNSSVTPLNQALDSQIILEAANIPAGLLDDVSIGPDSIGTSELKNDAVETLNIKDLNVTNAKLAANTIQSGKVSIFKSAEITGDTTAQSTAHGLARTPAIVFAFVTDSNSGAAGGLVEGSHTGTNVVVTAPTGVKYRVIAF